MQNLALIILLIFAHTGTLWADSLEDRISQLDFRGMCLKSADDFERYAKDKLFLTDHRFNASESARIQWKIAEGLLKQAYLHRGSDKERGCYALCEHFGERAVQAEQSLPQKDRSPESLYYKSFCKAQKVRVSGVFNPDNIRTLCSIPFLNRGTRILISLGADQFIQDMQTVIRQKECIDRAGAHRNLGYLYYLMCRDKDSLKQFQQAIKNCKPVPLNQCLLARSYYENGKQSKKEAKEAAKQCLQAKSSRAFVQEQQTKVKQWYPHATPQGSGQ